MTFLGINLALCECAPWKVLWYPGDCVRSSKSQFRLFFEPILFCVELQMRLKSCRLSLTALNIFIFLLIITTEPLSWLEFEYLSSDQARCHLGAEGARKVEQQDQGARKSCQEAKEEGAGGKKKSAPIVRLGPEGTTCSPKRDPPWRLPSSLPNMHLALWQTTIVYSHKDPTPNRCCCKQEEKTTERDCYILHFNGCLLLFSQCPNVFPMSHPGFW